MKKGYSLFRELLLISVGAREGFLTPLSESDLNLLYKESARQSLMGVLYPCIERALASGTYTRNPRIAYQWTAVAMRMRTLNEMQNRRAAELTEIFADAGFRSCVLKGQSVARLYPDPALRQCGDIDIWVEGDRSKLVEWMRTRYSVSDIVYHHSEVAVFPDAPVEVHFHPTWLCNPGRNRKLQAYFDSVAPQQFANMCPDGFNTPTVEFQAVQSLIHIYRHLFDGGIGIRQIMDYYYILKAMPGESRERVYSLFEDFGTARFAAGLMWVMKELFEMDDTFLLCEPDASRGVQILHTAIRGGNFGFFYAKTRPYRGESLLHRVVRRTGNLFGYVRFYPSEVLWIPIWRIWHWFKRKSWN